MMRKWVCRIRRLAVTAIAAVILAGAVASAASARLTAIFYQCASQARICAIAPAGGLVGRLAHAGTFAGVTSDGQTYGYHDVAGISEAPVTGGAAAVVNVADGVGYPLMSGDGSAFLDNSAAASGIDFVTEYRAAPGPSTAQMSLDTNLGGMPALGGLSYGWSGSTPLTAHWTADATWICVGGQDGDYCGQDAATARTLGANTSVEDPDGSPDGSQIVAVTVAPSSLSPAIVLFDARTGALVRTLVPAHADVSYATPRFSPDGTAIVFEEFPTIGAQTPKIETVAIDGGPVHTVADGSDPFWAPATAAPRPRASLPTQTLTSDSRARRLLVSCHLTGVGRCAVTATITAHAAHALGLAASVNTPYRLASGARTTRRAGAATLKLSLQPRAASAIRPARALSIQLTATSTAPGRLTQTTSAHVILRARMTDPS
jgi:hypothetical protein